MSGTHDIRTAAHEPITQPPRPRQPRFWCHECQREIEPLMAPSPTCPVCREQFVEEIEDDNDPRGFMHPENDDEEWQIPFPEIPGNDSEPAFPLDGSRGIDPQIITVLEAMLHQMVGPGSVRFEPVGGRTRTAATGAATGAQGEAEPPRPSFPLPSLGMFFGTTTPTQEAGRQTSNQPQQSAAPPMPPLLNFLQQLGGLDGRTGNVFTMSGNTSDYVWSQAGLDNIVTQLMEQAQARNAPPPAPDNIIDSLPVHNIDQEEVDKNLECAVCKDEFVLNEEAITLPCTHTFHDPCIRPWLKMNGTCPVCRYSLVNNNDNARNTTSSDLPTNLNIPGAFPPNVTPNATPSSGLDNHTWGDEMDEMDEALD